MGVASLRRPRPPVSLPLTLAVGALPSSSWPVLCWLEGASVIVTLIAEFTGDMAVVFLERLLEAWQVESGVVETSVSIETLAA